jgi:hypothetical protein
VENDEPLVETDVESLGKTRTKNKNCKIEQIPACKVIRQFLDGEPLNFVTFDTDKIKIQENSGNVEGEAIAFPSGSVMAQGKDKLMKIENRQVEFKRVRDRLDRDRFHTNTWVLLLQRPSPFCYDEALLLCRYSETEWLTWIPEYGEAILPERQLSQSYE